MKIFWVFLFTENNFKKTNHLSPGSANTDGYTSGLGEKKMIFFEGYQLKYLKKMFTCNTTYSKMK